MASDGRVSSGSHTVPVQEIGLLPNGSGMKFNSRFPQPEEHKTPEAQGGSFREP
jgi:hypothetical protein